MSLQFVKTVRNFQTCRTLLCASSDRVREYSLRFIVVAGLRDCIAAKRQITLACQCSNAAMEACHHYEPRGLRDECDRMLSAIQPAKKSPEKRIRFSGE
jgi:hypothetical protein